MSYYGSHLSPNADQKTLRRAIALQKKQYVKDQAQYGQDAPNTILSLASWVPLLVRDGSSQSRELAIQELDQTVDAVLLSGSKGKSLFDAGANLAVSYKEGRFGDAGLDKAQVLRQQLIFRESSNNRTNVMKDITSARRSKLTFLTAFETRLEGAEGGFAQVHSRSFFEVALWDSFEALRQSNASCEQILANGANLKAVLKKHYPTYTGEDLQQTLSEVFMKKYGSAFTTGTQGTNRFFKVLLNALSADPSDVNLPHVACVALIEGAQNLLDQRDFEGLFDLVISGFDFIHHVGAFGNESDVASGFQLGLLLGEVGPRLSPDQGVSKQMLEFSKLVLREIMQLCRSKDFGLENISIDELSKLAAVLGSQQNYLDLEARFRLLDIITRMLT